VSAVFAPDEEDTSFSRCRRVGGSNDERDGREEFEEASWSVLQSGGEPTEIVQEIVGILGHVDARF
jgi:hypothetical protein